MAHGPVIDQRDVPGGCVVGRCRDNHPNRRREPNPRIGARSSPTVTPRCHPGACDRRERVYIVMLAKDARWVAVERRDRRTLALNGRSS